jgi:hypothetical protein
MHVGVFMHVPSVMQMHLWMHPMLCRWCYACTLCSANAFMQTPSFMRMHFCIYPLLCRYIYACTLFRADAFMKCTLSLWRWIYACTLFNAEASWMHPPLCRFISHAVMQMHFCMHALLWSSLDACTLCYADGSRLWPWLCGSPPWLVVSTSSCSPSQVPEYIDYLTPRWVNIFTHPGSTACVFHVCIRLIYPGVGTWTLHSCLTISMSLPSRSQVPAEIEYRGHIHRRKVCDLCSVTSSKTTFSSWFEPHLEKLITMKKLALLMVIGFV